MNDKLTPDQFAQKIKDQYPQYANLDNNTLVQKMLQKYPQYADKVNMGTQAPAGQGGSGYPNVPPLLGLGNIPYVGGPLASTVGFLSDVGTGIGSAIGQTGLGLGKAAVDVVNAPFQSKFLSDVSSKIGDISSAMYPTPQSVGGTVGNLIGQGAVLASPTKLVTAGKEALTIPGLAESGTLGKGAQTVLHGIPEAGVGTVYGASQGQSPGQALTTGLTFGALSTSGEALGSVFKKYWTGTNAENLSKALGIPTGGPQTLEKEAQAMKFLYDNSGQIRVGQVTDATGKVIDTGIPFDPKTATYDQTIDALTQMKDKLYAQYTNLAKQAGDKGALFNDKDYKDVYNYLESLKPNTTGATRNAITSLQKDWQTNYEGQMGYKGMEGTQPLDIQAFIQQINKSVEPGSSRAVAEVSQALSGKLRSMMEDKVLSSTGKSYQQIRDGYSALKTLEGPLNKQWARAAAQAGQPMGDNITKWGIINVGIGTTKMLLGHPTGAYSILKGGSEIAFGTITRRLTDNQRALQTFFKSFEPEAQSPFSIRAFGKNAQDLVAPLAGAPTNVGQ